MSPATATRIAAIIGFLAVGLGAFGAHGLKPILEQHATAATWQTAVFYHAFHAVTLLVLAQRDPLPRLAIYFMAAGIVVFSGSLYVLSVTNIRWLGAITPIGGVAFLIGWVVLAIKPQGSAKR